MAEFARSRERAGSRGPRNSSPRRSFGGSSGFRDRPRSRDGRAPMRKSKDKSNFQMTKVNCSSCGVECEVPFKPTSDKPVYCDDCFRKNGKSGSSKPSSKDFDIINEKLDKIIKSLNIE